jgi:hypothetical protein
MMPLDHISVNTIFSNNVGHAVKSLTAAEQRQILLRGFSTGSLSRKANSPMSKPILLLPMIAFALTLQQQTVDREQPDLLVVKFSWAKEKQKVSVIRGAQNPGGQIVTPVPDARDHKSRIGDLRSMEKKAESSAAVAPLPTYQLRLELKNTGTNVVRSLAWQFKPTAMPEDYEPKQYLCALQVKPKEKKLLELWTPYAPVKVISVDERSNALKDGEVVINKIEYTDGSVWTRPGWTYKLPANASHKLAEGTCSTF